MNTGRVLEQSLLSEEERAQFRLFIRVAPWLYAPLLSELEKTAFQASSLLDVACGDGYLLSLLALRHPHLRLSGSDLDPVFIEQAKKLYSFPFQVEDAHQLDQTADIITCNLALHHFTDPVPAIQQLYKQARQRVIIADQLRPVTESDLEAALVKRQALVGPNDVPYYVKNERKSILEAYRKDEILDILQSTKIPYNLSFFNNDYYERMVVVSEK